MDREMALARTHERVRALMQGEGSGHDWWHVYRVWRIAAHIGAREKADPFVVELAALLHDIADWKFHGGDVTAGPRAARAWLETLGVAEETVAHVCEIIGAMSYKGAGVPDAMRTREGMVVQDADRLDAIGAIGIARTFAYGGHKGRDIWDPDRPPRAHASAEEYLAGTGSTIDHFYEKLLLLRARMNTETARRMAAERHSFMEQFLQQFYAEWNGKA
jgi:uncharacterized protein